MNDTGDSRNAGVRADRGRQQVSEEQRGGLKASESQLRGDDNPDTLVPSQDHSSDTERLGDTDGAGPTSDFSTNQGQTPVQQPVSAQGVHPAYDAHLYGASYPQADVQEEAFGTDLLELVRTLWRRKAYVIGSVLIAMSATLTFLLLTEQRYTAEAQVQVQSRQPNIAGIESMIPELSGDQNDVVGAVQAINSSEMAQKVIEQTGLVLSPEFNPAIRDDDTGRADRLYSVLNGATVRKIDPSGQSGFATGNRADIIRKFLRGLKVTPIDRSNVLAIQYTSKDPELAAAIANAIAAAYVDETLTKKFETTTKVAHWVSDRLVELQAAVETSEQAIERFRADQSLVEGVRAPLHTEQVSRINAELAIARAAASEAGARLSEVRDRLESSDDVAFVASALSSPVIQDLRRHQTELVRREAELSREYGPDHPIRAAESAELESVVSRLQEEIERITDNLASEERVARARVLSLEQELKGLEGKAADANSATVLLRSLERDAEANRNLYELFLGRYKEMTIQDGIQQADVQIITLAEVPINPSFPKKRQITALALVISSLLGIGLALIVERLDITGYRSAEQIRSGLGIPVFAMVPAVPGRKRGRPEEYLLKQPTSAFAESLRDLRTSLFLSTSENTPRSVLITSSIPGEGKSSTAVSFGRMLAQAGEKVIILDCDFRRPKIEYLIQGQEAAPGPGMSDYLRGEDQLTQVTRVDSATTLRFISSGTQRTPDPQMFQSERMKDLLNLLKREYDTILIDSPPTLPVSDARALAQICDVTVFLVYWEKTRREIAKNGVRILSNFAERAPLIGAVLSRVDVRKHARYGYGDSGYYYGRYSGYYSDSHARS